MDGLLNSREIAVGLWLVAIIVFAVSFRVVRKSVVDVLNAFFTPKLFIPLVASFLPTILVITILAYLNWWDTSVLKETIYWVVGTGLVMFSGFTKVQSVKELFKKTIKDTLKLVIILEFFVGFYVFPLWIELLLFPFVTLVILLSTVADYQKSQEYDITRKFLKGLVVAIGLVVLLFAVIAFMNNPRPLFTYHNLELFLLPILLSFMYIPAVYLLALYSKYELVFNRINHFLKLSNKDKRAVKIAAIRRCGFSAYITGEMIRHLAINLNNGTTKHQALRLVQDFDPNTKSFL